MKQKILIINLTYLLFSSATFAQTTPPSALNIKTEQQLALAQAYASPSANLVAANPGLNDCLTGVGSGCDSKPHPLQLFQGNSEVTGFYDINGKKCTPGSKECAFHVYATYTAGCLTTDGTFQPTCSKPNEMKINYFVKQYNVPTGMPPISTVSTESGGRAAAVLSFSKLNAQQGKTYNCAEMYPAETIDPSTGVKYGTTKAYNLGTDAYGDPICGEDPNKKVIDELTKELCKTKVQAIWVNGGTVDTPACGKITITKVFKLTNSAKTTSDCTTQGGTVYDGSNASPNLNAYPGGTITVSDLITSESSFLETYKYIQTSSPTFGCKKPMIRDVSNTKTSGTGSFQIPSNYVTGSLQVELWGGGSGGDSAGTLDGGSGGGAGQHIPYKSLTATAGMTCSYSIGGGGSGGTPGYAIAAFIRKGGQGGDTTVTCSDTVTATGGTGQGKRSGSCKGGHGDTWDGTWSGWWGLGGCDDGVTGENSAWAGGGDVMIGGQRGGGGGGGCCAHDQNGGNGANGQLIYKWKESAFQDFVPQ